MVNCADSPYAGFGRGGSDAVPQHGAAGEACVGEAPRAPVIRGDEPAQHLVEPRPRAASARSTPLHHARVAVGSNPLLDRSRRSRLTSAESGSCITGKVRRPAETSTAGCSVKGTDGAWCREPRCGRWCRGSSGPPAPARCGGWRVGAHVDGPPCRTPGDLALCDRRGQPRDRSVCTPRTMVGLPNRAARFVVAPSVLSAEVVVGEARQPPQCPTGSARRRDVDVHRCGVPAREVDARRCEESVG